MKITKEMNKLIKWFKKTAQTNSMGYDELVKELISYRKSDDKGEKAIYDLFIDISEEEWFEVERKVEDL